MKTLPEGHPDRIVLEGVLMMRRVDASRLLEATDLAEAAGKVLMEAPEGVREEFYRLYEAEA